MEGHRLKDKNDGQTFKSKLQEQVLPKSLSITFDPTLSQFNGQALNGHYQFDDEGIAGQKVKVVDNGILKTFLMSRTPIENLRLQRCTRQAVPSCSSHRNLIMKNTEGVS